MIFCGTHRLEELVADHWNVLFSISLYQTRRNYVTVADVNVALEEILATGETHFIYLWTESTGAEQLALTALSRMMPITGQATPVQVVDYLAEHGIKIERPTMGEALHHLALRDILSGGADPDPTLGQAYSWQLGLLGLWVETYKSLSHVIDEVG